jgi:hypothetical protein
MARGVEVGAAYIHADLPPDGYELLYAAAEGIV